MIINLEDEHWKDCLIDKESEDIYRVFKRQRTQLPDDMRLFLDAIPVSDNIEILFNHINNQRADPGTQRGLYFLKTTLLYSLDLFRTQYLPLTDQGERDILRRVWIIIDWAFDGSHLKTRNERGSAASKIDKNKRRKAANTAMMDKQKPSAIPDLLVFYDRYEFCAVEANKKEYDDTKEKNDSSKLSLICKQMLLNLSYNSPSLQHDLTIVGLSISRMKLTVRELCNPEGVVCVSKITKELHYPVHMLEWRSKMLDLCEELWILRMEIERRFIAVCTTSKGSGVCTLKSCFQTNI
ncbi:MAG: hypothetical protein EXX96DRAFT_487810 [Benjaminiella poitrasii]|nr:MAG: hypothetical protein EXX96DRAFT_487810 [Benjaminiella poitrasii]